VAFDSLPPWIAGITPNLFSQALQAGAHVGLALTDQSLRAQAAAQALAQRQAEAQERADAQAERQREFEETRLLNVQKIAQDAAQLQQLQKHQTAQEANQAAQESRLLDYQTGMLGARQKELELEGRPATVVDFGPGVGKAIAHGKSLTFPSASLLPKEPARWVEASGTMPAHWETASGSVVKAPAVKEGTLTDVEKAMIAGIDRQMRDIRTLPQDIAALERRRNNILRGNMSDVAVAPTVIGTNAPTVLAPVIAPKPLSKEQAASFLKQAGGDKAKARQLARDAGFTF